ncbi:hypothetical protein [Spiroplasma endosymbiont of Amphibalanus improvisus]|uniref:hypothetical protein n=1 Tax=Spiroplasma endosymbiont of Amphibalanus improvisus TaxID=3066327 RepID=UPI00313AFFB0
MKTNNKFPTINNDFGVNDSINHNTDVSENNIYDEDTSDDITVESEANDNDAENTIDEILENDEENLALSPGSGNNAVLNRTPKNWKKIFKITAICYLIFIFVVIIMLFSWVVFFLFPDSIAIDSKEIKEDINKGGIIMIRSQPHKATDPSTIVSTSEEIEAEFVNWFNAKVESINGHKVQKDVDYTLKLISNNGQDDWTDSILPDDTWYDYIVVKEMEITPLPGSKYIKGYPIDLPFVVSPYLCFTNYDYSKTINLTADEQYYISLPGIILHDKKWMLDGNKFNDDDSLTSYLLDHMDQNLIGWNYDYIKTNTRLVKTAGTDYTDFVEGAPFTIAARNKDESNPYWFGNTSTCIMDSYWIGGTSDYCIVTYNTY